GMPAALKTSSKGTDNSDGVSASSRNSVTRIAVINSVIVTVRVWILTGARLSAEAGAISIIPRRSPSLRSMSVRYMSDKSPCLFDARLNLFRCQVTVAGRQKSGVRAFLGRNQIHVLELARVSVGPNFLEDIPENLTQRSSRFRRQFVKTQSAHENAFDLIAAEAEPLGRGRDGGFGEGKLQPFSDREQKVLRFFMRLGRKQRDVHVEPSLT